MTRSSPFALAAAAVALLATTGAARPLGAQSIFDSGLRVGPQFIQYQIKPPSGSTTGPNETVSEFAVPVFLLVPVTSALSFDIGTSYAFVHYEGGNGPKTISEISGLTDTQLRANYTLGTDFVVLTAGVNLPTGRETAKEDETLAANRIGSDFFSFPISNMGTGLGGTGGIAIARPLGDDWNLGLGISARRSAAYDPFQDAQGSKLRFQPGNEYRARIGVDHTGSAGRVMLGFTYSKFGDDRANISASDYIYNTGDRYISQASYTQTMGGADLVLAGWDLYRSSGTLLGGSPSGHENIANVLVGVGFRSLGGYVQPTAEIRNWSQATAASSTLGNLGLRLQYDLGGFGVSPSAGFSVGRLGSSGGSASIVGFHGALVIRLGQ